MAAPILCSSDSLTKIIYKVMYLSTDLSYVPNPKINTEFRDNLRMWIFAGKDLTAETFGEIGNSEPIRDILGDLTVIVKNLTGETIKDDFDYDYDDEEDEEEKGPGGDEVYDALTELVKAERIMFAEFFIEQDDSVYQVMNKMSHLINKKSQTMYSWVVKDDEPTAMMTLGHKFEWKEKSSVSSKAPEKNILIKKDSDKNVSEKLNFEPSLDALYLNPDNHALIFPDHFDPILNDISFIDEENKLMNMYGSHLLDDEVEPTPFALGDLGFNIVPSVGTIYMISHDHYAKMIQPRLPSKAQSAQFTELYYPRLPKDLESYELEGDDIDTLNFTIRRDNLILDLINYNKYEEGDEEVIVVPLLPDIDTQLQINPCYIYEITIHVNYGEQFSNQGNFIDLHRILQGFKVSDDTPFISKKGDKLSDSVYKIHKKLTDSTSELYLEKEVLTDWLKSSGKSLSIKKYNDTAVTVEGQPRKYITIDIHRDGKVEVLCSWSYNPDVSIGLEHVEAVKQKAREVIEQVKKLQYHHVDYPRSLQLNNIRDDDANSRVVLINMEFRYENALFTNSKEYIATLKKFCEYFPTHISLVNQNDLDQAVSDTQLRLRYKRVNNFVKLTGLMIYIHRELANFRDNREGLIRYMVKKFNLRDKSEAEQQFEKYESFMKQKEEEELEELPKDEPEGKKKRKKKEEIDLSDKQSGVDIKISSIKGTKTYKVTMLGINMDQIKYIYPFILRLLTLHNFVHVKTMPKAGAKSSKVSKGSKVTKIKHIEIKDIEELDDEVEAQLIEDLIKIKDYEGRLPTDEIIEQSTYGNVVDGSSSSLNFGTRTSYKTIDILRDVAPKLFDLKVFNASSESNNFLWYSPAWSAIN